MDAQSNSTEFSASPGPDGPAPAPISDADATPAPADRERTWDPAAGDPFAELLAPVAGTANEGRGSNSTRETIATPPGTGLAAAPTEPGGSATPVRRATGSDPDRTPPAGSRGLELWKDDFDSLTPNMTLKLPGSRSARPRSGAAARPAGLPSVTVDGYELLRVLGEGGVGIVYQAVQKSIERDIAVKMIKPGVGDSPHDRAKFLAEAVVTGKLDHPNIVPIHDLGTTRDGQPFYVMKLVRGTPWNAVIRTSSLAENLRILIAVCDAVSFAHSKGVIHRDLKPENVMLGEFGEVQLMDWGLGLLLTDDGAAARTQSAGGTPAYMAPEMVTGEGGPVGVHSDVYLLGGILYEIVTGLTPHGGHRVMDCLQNALQNIIQPTERTGLLVDIARRAMQTNPADRYPSAQALKEALQTYQTNAESIHLSQRSAERLQQAIATRDYEAFAQALFGFREALKQWADNADARSGVRQAQLAYARCAFEKGDLDLAASTLDRQCPAHAALLADIQAAQDKRGSARRWLRILRNAAIALALTVIVTLTVASVWISRAKQQAEVAREAAVAAQLAEAQQRREAEEARARAQQEETRAVQALADLEQAVKRMMEAKTQEEKAVAQAEASNLVAVQTRDELAKSGMLLDNSWWGFGADLAAQHQAEAACELDLPPVLTLRLAGDVLLELSVIPAGEFVMGSPPKEEKRAADEYLHRVRLTRAFYLARCELTEAQWAALTGAPPLCAAGREPDAALPVVGVSYDEVQRELLPALAGVAPPGYEFRLPTEAEWEYACRAGTGTAYGAGDGLEALEGVGWYLTNSERVVQRVASKRPNAFGLYDMHGNVGEMCADGYAVGFYLESPTDDPVAREAGEKLVVRGGSVLNTAEHCRSAYRSYVYRKNRYEFLGLRLALVRPAPGAGE